MHFKNLNDLYTFLFIVGGIIFGLVLGYAVFSPSSETDHFSTEHTHDTMAHEQYEMQSDNIPAINVVVTKDSVSGWNLNIRTSKFKFTPEKSGLENVEGEGHAHLYINDVKVNRIYSEWYHINPENLKVGDNVIRVTLNTNDHREYATTGVLLQDTEVITIE